MDMRASLSERLSVRAAVRVLRRVSARGLGASDLPAALEDVSWPAPYNHQFILLIARKGGCLQSPSFRWLYAMDSHFMLSTRS